MPQLASTAPLGTLVQGTISPVLPVPSSIPRPEYVGKAGPAKFTGSEVKTAQTIEKIRVASKIAAQAIVEVGKHIKPGVTTDQLDRVGHEFLLAHDAYPSTLGYRGFPEVAVLLTQ